MTQLMVIIFPKELQEVLSLRISGLSYVLKIWALRKVASLFFGKLITQGLVTCISNLLVALVFVFFFLVLMKFQPKKNLQALKNFIFIKCDMK